MASFVDRAPVKMKAGNGGDGAVSFHREKFVLNGGPDGGDGGNGGNIVLIADSNMHTLLDFRYHVKFHAENGENGKAMNATGKSGESLMIKVPVGTVVRDKKTGDIVADMSVPGREKILLHGGRGGFGNARFKSSVRQAPAFAKPGIRTEEKEFMLELKSIADVGLVGYPNVGKSSLLSRVTKARPRIANYHFTTLTPNLGMVMHKGVDYTMADIPGLVENASEGAGLGFYFLRHIERTRLLLHVVDVSGSEGRDPVQDYRVINRELQRYGGLDDHPMVVAANKMDLPFANENLERLREAAGGIPVFPISAATGEGLEPLMDHLSQLVSALPPPAVFEEAEVDESPAVRGWTIEKEGGVYVLSGASVENLIRSVNFDDHESMRWFHRVLRTSGIIDGLREKGCEEGDTVRLLDMEFDFVE